MLDLITRLYPILRSITGDGNRKTLRIIQEQVPSLVIHEVPSGTQCLDWTVPPEWNCRSARLYDPTGKVVVDMADHNLHVLNYSTPFSGEVSWDELEQHLFSLPDKPDLIPYRTSYYVRNWGFCLADNVKQALPRHGKFRVEIDSSLDENGSLTYGEFFLPGETEDEVMISVHICHPQLAIDNLSAVAVATKLAAEARPSYQGLRIVFLPGTIGPIVWMSRNLEKVGVDGQLNKIWVLALAGLAGQIQIKHPDKVHIRPGNVDSIIGPEVIAAKEIGLEAVIMPYEPYGYDERQYNTPDSYVPAVRLGIADYEGYPEYHTSADNLTSLNEHALKEFYLFMVQLLSATFEGNRYNDYRPAVGLGEPQYGKHGVYERLPALWPNKREREMAMFWLCSRLDSHTISKIAYDSGLPTLLLVRVAAMLVEVGLLVKLPTDETDE